MICDTLIEIGSCVLFIVVFGLGLWAELSLIALHQEKLLRKALEKKKENGNGSEP